MNIFFFKKNSMNAQSSMDYNINQSYFLYSFILIISFIYYSKFIYLKKFSLNFFIQDQFLSTNSSEKVFSIAKNCLLKSNSPYGIPSCNYSENNIEKINHYNHLLKVTEPFRNIKGHCWANYCGPWIEEVWLSTFCCNRSLNDFGPFIPLFISWLNIYKLTLNSNSYRRDLEKVFSYLNPNYLYITVVQSSLGIESGSNKWDKIPPNLLILSPAGRGHIPIPHLKEEQNISNILPKKYKLIFQGSYLSYPPRKDIMNEFTNRYKELFKTGSSNNWTLEYLQSDFVLAPRGYARATFRAFEILEMGLIPIFIFSNSLWIPYWNSRLDWENLAIIGYSNNLKELFDKIDSITDDRIKEMRTRIRNVRNSHFTYNAIMNQIYLFMNGGYYLSDLRCDKYTLTGN